MLIMDINRVIIKPLLTEKTYALNSLEPKQYAFLVDPKANKYQVASAFAALFDFTPIKVNLQIRKSTKVRTGTKFPGYSKLIKIAYITLPKGKDINVTNEESKNETKKVDVNKEKSVATAKTKGTLKTVETKKDSTAKKESK